MNNITILVARYKEDVNWTKAFSNVIIYNKGIPLGNDFNEVLLDNVGRESHTYYKYIYDNYYNLSEYTVFLQGYPFDHTPDIIKLLEYYRDTDFNLGYKSLCKTILKCNLTGCIYHHGLPLIDTYEKIFGKREKNLEFEFGAGAQFIVSKENILQHSRDFYLNIVELSGKDINPVEGYVLERFHKIIFDK